MRRILGAIADFFSGLFSGKTRDMILAGLRRAAPYISGALEVVAVIAQFTSGPLGRTMTTILAAANQLGVRALLRSDMSDVELATAMRDVAVEALKRKYPDADLSDLIRAVEIAVGAVKSNGV